MNTFRVAAPRHRAGVEWRLVALLAIVLVHVWPSPSSAQTVVAPFLQACFPGNVDDLSSNGCACNGNLECIGVCPVGSPGTRGCAGGPAISACAPIGNGLDLSANGCECTSNNDCEGVCPVGTPPRFCAGGPGGAGPPPRRCDAPGNGLNLNLDGCPCNSNTDCAGTCSFFTRTCGGVVGAVADRAIAIAGTASPQSAILGDVLSVSATVSSGIPTASRVTYTLHPPGDTTCQSSVATGSTAIAGMGAAPSFATSAATMGGVHRWTARYSGNAWNLPASTNCTAATMSVTITAALFANGFE